MLLPDLIRFTSGALLAHKTQSFLTALGIAVGIAAVVLLTSIGKGVHRFVLAEFTQFGTSLVAVNPGRIMTMGTPLGVLGTIRLLTLSDAEALRKLPHVQAVVPVVTGNAEVESSAKRRRTTVSGAGHDMPKAFRMKIASGRFLPADDPHAPRAFAVLGSRLRSELFSSANPLGSRIRIGGYSFRIVGVMESKGQILGFDMDDTVFIPAARALELFNREGLMEIDVLYDEDAPVGEVTAGIRRMLTARHGQEDFTITSQQQMLDILGSVLDILTIAVGALGGISLLVGSVGILAVMTIAVSERAAEIGLLCALGATGTQVLVLFLMEAVMLSASGGFAGLAIGIGGAHLLRQFVPALPVHTPWSYVILAELMAALIGLIAGAVPAWRAASMNPVEALRGE
ncbi:MAG TPA: ABC transporter permease [Thermodesulfobacteriaceae bacterium]|nr:ABC transporter permease [Thermodesulfobacteriaceae bacterium]